MQLYFIKFKNQYLAKTSTLTSKPNIVLTYLIDEARYWDNPSTTKSQVSKLRDLGYDPYISCANVIEINKGE